MFMRTRRKGEKGPLEKKLAKSAEPFYGREIGFRIERALKDSGPKTTILWLGLGKTIGEIMWYHSGRSVFALLNFVLLSSIVLTQRLCLKPFLPMSLSCIGLYLLWW